MSIKDYIGCCGFYYCKKCAYYTGEITDLAGKLVGYVKKYKSLELLGKSQSRFYYSEFKASLEWLADKKTCGGCRHDKGRNWWPDCPIRLCVLEKNIDFCFNCELFPCDKIEKNLLRDRILKANRYLAGHEVDESDYDPVLNLL
jgi:hypothetical protein